MRMETRSMTSPDASGVSREGNKIRLKIPYNSVSSGLGFKEVIAPGAFRRTLEDPDSEVLGFWNHDSSKPMGRRSNGSLSLEDDDEGLMCEITGDESSWCQDAVASVRSGNVNGSSFGFMVVDDEWDYADESWLRRLTDVDLLEISPTALPAYPESTASTA